MKVPDEVLQQMGKTNALFCDEVVAQKRFEAVDQVYAANACVLPPGVPIQQGREAIREFWKVAVEGMGITGATLRTVFAEMAGDTVVEIGQAELALKTGDPASVKYIVHWKQEEGVWLWDKDIWN